MTSWKLDGVLLRELFHNRFASFKEFLFVLSERRLFAVGFYRFYKIMKIIDFKEGHTNDIVIAFVVTYVDEECICIDAEMLVSIRDDINHNVKVCNVKFAHTRSCVCSFHVEIKSNEVVGKQLYRREIKQVAELM